MFHCGKTCSKCNVASHVITFVSPPIKIGAPDPTHRLFSKSNTVANHCVHSGVIYLNHCVAQKHRKNAVQCHSLDKPARLRIRVLLFLFLIFVKSEVKKQIGRRWHCLHSSLSGHCDCNVLRFSIVSKNVKHITNVTSIFDSLNEIPQRSQGSTSLSFSLVDQVMFSNHSE